MSKSVLVMDTPESCRSCYLRGFTLNSQYCRWKPRNIEDISIKPDWCPLKPLPEKMTIPRGARNTDDLEYAAGYNTCINEITGGNVND